MKKLSMYEAMRAEHQYLLYVYRSHEQRSKVAAAILAAWGTLSMPLQYLRARRCRHEWQDESHAGPDSGHEFFTCKKCGYMTDVIWY